MASSKKAVKSAKQAKTKAKAPPRPAPKSAKPTRVTKAKAAPKAASKAAPKAAAKAPQAEVSKVDPKLFDPLTPGEIADALRTLTEDRRLGSMAKVGRYRVICTEPLVVKPPHWMHGHRLARVVIYDYSADRCVDGCVDLDAGVVAHLELTKGQPMLSRDEEALAVSIAMADEGVRERLGLGDVPQVTTHYWGRNPSEIAYARRSAAVVFGRADGHPTLVAVVDLLDSQVTNIVPAEQW
jgi:Cu2+-containing amine oxidase